MRVIIKDWQGKNYYYGNDEHDIINDFRCCGDRQDELIYRIVDENKLEEENWNAEEVLDLLKEYLPKIDHNFYLEIEEDE